MNTKSPLVFALIYCTKFLVILVITQFSINVIAQSNPTTYFEDFNNAGYPTNLPQGAYWTFHNEIHPSQSTWNQFIPGDGNAYITVDADISNDTDWIHPFQTMEFGGVGENHRLEVRMKGAVVDGGLVGFLFTYNQVGSTFNEVDIEVVARDLANPPHETLPENNGWTDARFNTWRNANEYSEKPFTGTKKAVINQLNEKISLIDDQFHIYTIEWRSNRIDFFIDNVLQETITTNVATGWSEVIFGFRQLPWAGNFNWSGTHTMVIDYLKIEPIEDFTFAIDDFFVVDENTTNALDVLANDSGNTEILSFDTQTSQGFTLTGDNTIINYTAPQGFIGQDSFNYTIVDTNGTQVTATVSITVQEYVPPLDAVDDAITVEVGSVDTPIDVIANDSYGRAGENLTHPITLPGGKIATASVNGGAIAVVNGKVNYTPPSGFSGIDTFEYTITDALGYADQALVTITVGEVAQATANNDAFDVVEDTATNLDVLANDSVGTSIITFDDISTQGFTVTANGSQLTYTPANGFLGTDTFTYTIQNSFGEQSTATVTLTVVEAPVSSGVLTAVDDSITVAPNSSAIAVDVLANDNYGDNGPMPGYPLTLTNGKMIHASANGSLIAIVNNKVEYTPLTGFIGVDTFTYTITDSKGFAATGTVNVTVGGVVPAVANNDTYNVEVDTATNLNVLANDSAGTSIIAFDEVSAQGFTITGTATSLTYTPANGYLGADSFSYTIENGNGEQSTATVSITVIAAVVASGPLTAVDDTVTIAPNSAATLIDVLANDNYGENGPIQGHPLTLTNGKMVHASNNGSLIAIVNDKVSYTPLLGFKGADFFTYTLTDSKGFAVTATVNIIVGGNEPALANDDSFTVDVDTATILNVLANDSYGASIVLFDEVTTQGFAVTANGTNLIYTPNGGFLGSDTFTYTIEDDNGVQSTATVTLTVAVPIVASGPLTAVDDAITVTPNSVATQIDVLANDNFGVNGPMLSHPLTLTNGKMVHASNNGGYIAVVNGKVSYAPPTNFTGIDNFTYTITDSKGFAEIGIVTINVGNTTETKSADTDIASTTDANNFDALTKNSLNVFPNPSKGYLNINVTSTNATQAKMLLVDVTGKIVYNSSIALQKGINKFDVNLNIASTVVFLKILSKQENYGISKIIIKN